AVGASINFHLIADNPLLILVLTLGSMLVKMGVLFAIGKYFKLSGNQNINFSIALCQVGEFAFVLFSFVSQLGIFDANTTGIMMAVTALSMTLAPLLFLFNDKVLQPRIDTGVKNEKEADVIDDKNKIIIAGFSHFGSTIGRFLRANGVNATILDNNSDQVNLLRKMGFKVFYGDATRLDLLESAGVAEAKIFIIAIDSPETNIELTQTLQKHFPHLEIMVRAKNRYDAYKLINIGAKNIYRESTDVSVRLGVDVLRKLGNRAYSSVRAGQNFLKYDQEALVKLAAVYHDKEQYISGVRQEVAQQEELLLNDKKFNPSENDHAWDSEFMRDAINKKK
ncbi:MAG: NAD-binding protein, partial [Cytophagaceae bacterium]|nr:NAD-binding protein [Cytophagaceae bacterium]